MIEYVHFIALYIFFLLFRCNKLLLVAIKPLLANKLSSDVHRMCVRVS